jgi:hypothetical protein
MQTTDQHSAHEQTLIDIVRRLPPERALQLVDFARFLASQTEQDDEQPAEEGADEIGANEEEWDSLLAKPEAKQAMREMAREALEDYHAGRTSDIAVTEDGQLAPE